MPETAHTSDESGVPPETQQILARARQGDKSVLPELRAVLDKNPVIWNALGDLSRHNCTTWVNLLAGNDLLAREAIMRNLAAMQQQLLSPKPSMLECLLAERVASCWMQTQHAETTIAAKAGSSLPLASYMLKRADSASRRLASAVKLLVTVQHLASRKATSSGTHPVNEHAEVASSTPAGATQAVKSTKKGKRRMKNKKKVVGVKPPSKVKRTWANDSSHAPGSKAPGFAPLDTAVPANCGIGLSGSAGSRGKGPAQNAPFTKSPTGFQKPFVPVNRLLGSMPVELVAADPIDVSIR